MEVGQVRHILEGVVAFVRKVEPKDRKNKAFMVYQFVHQGNYGIQTVEVVDFNGETDFKAGEVVSMVVDPRVEVNGAKGTIKYHFVGKVEGPVKKNDSRASAIHV